MFRSTINWGLMVLVIAAPGQVASHGPSGGSRQPVPPAIASAAVDLQQDLMTISGQNFGNAPPIVKLANQVLEVKSFSANRIVVRMPPDLPSATYLLTVTTGGARQVMSNLFSAAIYEVAQK